jgi:hypothetical protein
MAPRRVLALVEPGRGGDAAVLHARLIALSEPVALTVLALAPQASGPRCGTSILDYNAAVTEAAKEDLNRARAGLADVTSPTTYTVLAGRGGGLMGRYVAAGAFDLVLLPSRRRRPGHPGHPDAERLRAHTTAEIKVVTVNRSGRVVGPARASSDEMSRR